MSLSIRAALHAAFVALTLSAGPALAHEYKLGSLDIAHPWSRATPAGAKVAAGYLVVKSAGTEPDRLVSVSSDISGKAEIHEMSVDTNGVMTMRPVADGLEVPARGEVKLAPGGFHLMFIDLNQPVKQGERFKATLTFEKAGNIVVEFAGEAMAGSADHSTHGG